MDAKTLVKVLKKVVREEVRSVIKEELYNKNAAKSIKVQPRANTELKERKQQIKEMKRKLSQVSLSSDSSESIDRVM